MRELGQVLQEAREAKGLSLEQVENATHMRVKFLRALEQGQPDIFPTSLQMRGFLRNYAAYLGLDPLPFLERYTLPNGTNGRSVLQKSAQGFQPGAATNGEWRAMFRRPADISRRRPSFLSWDLFISVIVFAAVLAFVIWGGSQLINGGAVNLPFNLGAILATPAPTATDGDPVSAFAQRTTETAPSDTRSGASQSGTTSTPAPAIPEGIAQLDITATARSWVRITVDGEIEYEGGLMPDEHRTWQGQESIQLYTGNAGGLNVLFNGRPVGTLGSIGQIAQRTWTPAGEMTSTPMPTP
jgi:transcriptional regulator with XRE-family HTH domain